MAPHGHRRPSPAHGPLAVLGLLAPVVGLLFVGALWLMLAAPFSTDGDAPGARPGPDTPTLRAASAREDDRARLTIGGRTARSPTPLVVRILGRSDVAGPCPVPAVRGSGALVSPPGSVRVGWSRIAGRVPGAELPATTRFRLVGTVAARGSGALRLCVHLVRTGRAAAVVRTVRVVVPSRAGITPLSVPLRSVTDAVVLPTLRIVGLGVAAALTLWLVLRIRRRVRLARPERASRSGRRRRSGASGAPCPTEPGWSVALDLPPLPDDVRVPDAPPWDPGPTTGPAQDPGTVGGPAEGRGPVGGPADGRWPVGAPAQDPGPVGGRPVAPAFADGAASSDGSGSRVGEARPSTPSAVVLDSPVTPPGLPVGTAGASARAAGRRREARWRERRRLEVEAAGRVWDPTERAPFHVRAWAIGAEGEELAAERFAALARGYPGVHVLHDRREPGRGLANIDHVLVGPAGVVVADTKHWAGVVRIEDGRLHVRGKDRTAAVDGVLGQVSSIRAILAAAGLGAIPVLGVLHWTRSDGPPLDGSLELAGVPLLDARGTMVRASDGAVLGRDGVAQVVGVLESGLRPAG